MRNLVLAVTIFFVLGCVTSPEVVAGPNDTFVAPSPEDGDMDGDGLTCTLLDANVFFTAFNTSVGDANYNPRADFSGTGRVTILDYGTYLRICYPLTQ